MATTTVTAPVPGSGATVVEGTAGATIVAGQTVYLDSTTNTYKLADCGAATTDAMAGFAITGASATQPLKVLIDGSMTGVGLTDGEAYFLSTTAGDICLYADLVGGTDYITYVGTATSTTVILVSIHVSGEKLHA